jgi:hypothetical protein
MEGIVPSFPLVQAKQARRGSIPAAAGSAGGLQSAGIEVTTTSWKSDRIVRLLSGGEQLRVIGSDSVGSVICRPLGGGSDLDIYVPPSLLVAAEPQPGQSAEFTMENA